MNEFKEEWDNYPQEIYDKLKELGWHINIVDNEVLSAISPNADYIYSYCKGVKPEVRIFGRSYENIFRVCDGDVSKDTDLLMWNLKHSLDPH
jgi:hypothetical protein